MRFSKVCFCRSHHFVIAPISPGHGDVRALRAGFSYSRPEARIRIFIFMSILFIDYFFAQPAGIRHSPSANPIKGLTDVGGNGDHTL